MHMYVFSSLTAVDDLLASAVRSDDWLWQAGLEGKETETVGRDNGWLMVLAQKRPPVTLVDTPEKTSRFDKEVKPAN